MLSKKNFPDSDPEGFEATSIGRKHGKTLPVFGCIVLMMVVIVGLAGCIHIGDSTEAAPSDFSQQPISTEVRDPLAALTGTPMVSQASDFVTFTLKNTSDWDVCYVYIAPPTDDAWGKDWLGANDQIARDDTWSAQLKAGTYDMRVENCDYMRLNEQYGVVISDNYTWNVNGPDLFFYEDFNGSTSNWVSPQAGSGQMSVVAQALNLTATTKDGLALARYPQQAQDSIMVVEATQLQKPASGSSAFGMMCMMQNNGDGYLFLVRSDQQFSIQKVSGGKWTALVDWSSNSEAVFENGINILEIQCNAGDLSLRFNGLTMIKAQDSDFTQGEFGLAAFNFGDGTAGYKFDNLAVINP